MRLAGLALLIGLVGVWAPGAPGTPAPPSNANPDVQIDTAPVTIDGRVLFLVRGVSAIPAETRASVIAGHIITLATRSTFPIPDVKVLDKDRFSEIVADDNVLVTLFDADAVLEDIDRHALALAAAARIRKAIADYRLDRDPIRLRHALLDSAIATAVFVLSLLLIRIIWRLLTMTIRARHPPGDRPLATESLGDLQARQLWSILDVTLRGVRLLSIAALAYIYAMFVFGRFPWTREIARHLHDGVSGPLNTLWQQLIDQIPNLIFLAILITVVRYALRFADAFFVAIANGTLLLRNFEPEWVAPTRRIARLAILIVAVIVAYPYVPGSNSEAFKAISIFLGVLISLGSTSFLSNLIAGYAITYRRTFKVGDRVKIGDAVGDVVDVRLQVTHLRSLKNEEVIIPNSLILSSEVINYSSLAHTRGLILHTNVGIGYETPWRQVEAMLMLAAERTPGLLSQPRPFVLQRALGDFAVVYELNAYCEDAGFSPGLYAALHRNILDAFNEYGVQIMTPAYEGDPERPKIVPKEQWFAAPAAAGTPRVAPLRSTKPETTI